jgi:RNA polymerase sigma-70 factor (sigma-E family)
VVVPKLRPVASVMRAEDELIALYRERYASTVRLAFVLTAHSGVAEELAQEAFVRTWRSWDRMRDPEAAASYLRTTVLNLAKSSLRRRAVEIKHRMRRGEAAVERDAALRIDLIRSLQQLPPRQRACIALRYYEDLTEQETAQVLGISLGTVKSTTHRALKRLGQRLGGESYGS